VEHAKQVSKLRSELEATARELAAKSERRLKAAREEADLRRRQEIHQLEERKNSHIQVLLLVTCNYLWLDWRCPMDARFRTGSSPAWEGSCVCVCVCVWGGG
jgi:hypothetical protein